MIIYDVFINLLSNEFADVKTGFREKISFYKFEKKSKQWFKKFVNNNDGTVITTGSFIKYAYYQKIIEKIWDYVLKPSVINITSEDYIDNLVKDTKEYLISDNYVISVLDESILKELYTKILDLLEEYCVKQLSNTQKYMISKSLSKLIEQNDEIKELKSNIDSGISLILEKINDTTQIETEEDIREIYDTISKEMWKGNLITVYRLLPLLVSKNSDLEIGIKIKMEVLSDFNCLDNYIVEAWKKIKNAYIKNDLVQIIIAFNIENQELLLQLKKYANDSQIQEIIKNIINDKWDKIIENTEKEESGIIYKRIKVLNNYSNKQWLTKRLCVYYLRKNSLINTSNSIENIVKDEKNFVDEIIIAESKQLEIASSIIFDKQDIFENMNNELEEIKYKFYNANRQIQLKFYQLWLRTILITQIDNLESEIEKCPKWIQENDVIKAFVIQKKIENREIGIDELLDFSNRSGDYRLLCNYIETNKDNSLELKNILNKHLYLLEKEVSVFLSYIHVIREVDGENGVRDELEKYRENHLDVLEYWIERAKNNLIEEEDINYIFEKWKKRQLHILFHYSEVEFIKILLDRKRYDEANEIIEKVEKVGWSTDEMKRLKVAVLLNKQQYVNAFTVLSQIFKNYHEDLFVVDTLLTIAINNKRDVSNDIINAAIKIGTSRLFMLVSIIYQRNDDLEKAVYYMTKSLLLENGNNSDVYGNYFLLQNRVKNDIVRKVTCVDEEVAFCVENIKDGTKKTWCVYRRGILDSEPYIWKETINISLEKAISLEIIRKKVNDVIVLEGVRYKIIEILPVELYLYRICLEESTQKGIFKQISIPLNDDGSLDYGKFKNVMKEYIPDASSGPHLLEDYKDLRKVPLTFYTLSKGINLKYEQFVMIIIENDTIYIRENYFSHKRESDKFVLSFSALIMMHKLGVKKNYLLENDIVITKSTKQEILDETKEIVLANNQDIVSSMGRIEDNIYLQTATNEEKNALMKEAVEFNKYIENIVTEENVDDIVLAEQTQIDLVDIFGICDYDAMAIARLTERIFVAGEIASHVAFCEAENQGKDICIIDFLSSINIDIDDLLDYMNKMVEFRFLVSLTKYTLNYILSQYEKIVDIGKQEKVMGKWIGYLSLGDEVGGEYKNLFVQRLAEVYRDSYEDNQDSTNPIWKNFSFFIVKYFRRTIRPQQELKSLDIK